MSTPPNPVDSPPEPQTSSRWVPGILREAYHDFKHNESGPEWNAQDVFLFVSTSVLLTVFYYYCRPGYFRRYLWDDTGALVGLNRGDEYFGLLPYTWWAVMSIVVRMLIPCLIIWFVFKDKIRDYGYRLIGEASHAKVYALLFVGMVPIVYGVSLSKSFQRKYPFYKQAIQSVDQFVLYQLCYGVQFIALEAFFRGFIIFALYKRFGYYSLLIMSIPYCMIHFGKPVPETLGAIIAGVALGYLALKSKSWLYGGLLHWSVGITMDLMAIMHKGGFKS